MKEPAAREFAEKLIRERLHGAGYAARSGCAPAAPAEEEAQSWEEVG